MAGHTMILQSLKEFAARERLLENPDYEPKQVAWIIALDHEGRFLNVISTRSDEPKRKRTAKTMSIPRRWGRTSRAAADFLVDKSEYVLGVLPADNREEVEADGQVRLELRRKLFAEQIEKAHIATSEPDLRACLSFVESNEARQECVARLTGLGYVSNDLFAFEVDGRLVHASPAVQSYFAGLRRAESSNAEQCLICGAHQPPVDKHHAFQLRGGTSSGVPIVTVNADAFESYGWARSKNAPVCRDCADAYATALKRLLSDRYPDPERKGEFLPKRAVGLSADTTAIFWAEQDDVILNLFAELLDKPEPGDVDRLLTSPLRGSAPGLSVNRFFCLVLTGGQGRAIVRSMQTGFLAEVEQNVRRYFRALSAVSANPAPLYVLLQSLAVQGKGKNVASNLASELFLAILFGRHFPRAVLSAACLRSRAEQRVTGPRAMLLSAYFQSKSNRNEEVMGLNTNEPDPGYRLGRLLAVLERLQGDAQGKPNKTIVDRFYGAASTRPATVFPTLLGLSMHHTAKLKSPAFFQKQIGEVLEGLANFPTTLTLEEQGMFALGYFHQRQNYFRKAETDLPAESANEEQAI